MDHPKGDSVCAILCFFFCLAFLFCAHNVARRTIAVCTPKYNLILSAMTAAILIRTISKNDNKQKQTFMQRLKSTNSMQWARDWQVSYFFRSSTFIYFEHFVSVCSFFWQYYLSTMFDYFVFSHSDTFSMDLEWMKVRRCWRSSSTHRVCVDVPVFVHVLCLPNVNAIVRPHTQFDLKCSSRLYTGKHVDVSILLFGSSV